MLFSPLIIYISYSNPFSLFFLFQLFQIMPPVGTSLIIQSSPIILTVLRTNAYHTTNDHLCAHRKINGYESRLFIRLVIKFYLDKSNWIWIKYISIQINLNSKWIDLIWCIFFNTIFVHFVWQLCKMIRFYKLYMLYDALFL